MKHAAAAVFVLVLFSLFALVLLLSMIDRAYQTLYIYLFRCCHG